MTNSERKYQKQLTCSRCNTTKPIEEFYQTNYWWCKSCLKESAALYNPSPGRRQQTRNTSVEEYGKAYRKMNKEVELQEELAVREKIARMQVYISNIEKGIQPDGSLGTDPAQRKLVQQGDYWIWR